MAAWQRSGSYSSSWRTDSLIYGQRNQPDVDATSGLSPYLHFGHLTPWQVLDEVAASEQWSVELLHPGGNGKREGWWGMSRESEAFLDQMVTWRELGYGFAFHHSHDHESFESLPEWALTTLREHANDPREYVYVYGLDEFEAARTHDELWNAAQTELVREGRIHNYLRMLWGKKVLEWSPSPEDALAVMIELNNKYALDGRDPNSYSGIFWTLGRFDRPWAPDLIFSSEGEAYGGLGGLGLSSSLSSYWEVELAPDPAFPCEIGSYGAPCGATLTATSSFLFPGQHVITLEDSSRPSVAVLGLGLQRQAAPIPGGCTLYHDLQVLLPWSIDANGRATLVFDPPAIPGLTFKAQAATLMGGILHATNGLDVLCR